MAEAGVRRRTSFVPTVLLGLAGAGTATAAASQSWATGTTSAGGLRTVAARGSDVDPVALPLFLVALAAWGTVLVLRRRGRRVVAVLGLAAAVAAVVSVGSTASTSTEVAGRLVGDASDASTDATAWPYVAIAAGLVAAAGFVVVILRAPAWPEMSTRYDAPVDRPVSGGELSDADLWKALDAGDDPTDTGPTRDGSRS